MYCRLTHSYNWTWSLAFLLASFRLTLVTADNGNACQLVLCCHCQQGNLRYRKALFKPPIHCRFKMLQNNTTHSQAHMCTATLGITIKSLASSWNHCKFYFHERYIDELAHSDSIEFICAIQKNSMYVCMYVVIWWISHMSLFPANQSMTISNSPWAKCYCHFENMLGPMQFVILFHIKSVGERIWKIGQYLA